MRDMTQETLTAKDYLSDIRPIWCPGCGHFFILRALAQAFAWLKLPKEQIGLISGIGCSSRIPAYINAYGFHGVHGRALALGTGLKAVRPDMHVIVAGGDGDGYSIGGNHFIHACRRNMDMTYIVMDNEVYGMTKGQPSPTTEPDWESKFAPHGTGIRTFNPLGVALASGASFIARGFAGDPNGLTKLIVEAIEHKGFSLVEIKSPCVTFRPEEKEWSKTMRKMNVVPTDDVVEAARKIHSSDGLDTGIFYQATLPVFEPHSTKGKTVLDFEKEFEV
ncbi:MAG TPA: 2-oxoacid:ferredoxin oxidoreductase subunit beta [Sulfurovum sp.]|jgi:2-oxoglutarate ferredoxin oxidoreductase subunit beta|nr:MAG: 2-oxoglutarate synthase [Sulfurovum sp. 35-42-20]OYZ26623.1 MAG: 2-oxoglutarate synthase [Sulfurovum sp. 16-42-52]OYZ48707.1 MAG: 2-oxoglutarate synthase [Sulfurovum sp. 24-42-9]OZA47094.1 MAG: 2-oxoglutarate synthase [Sulfurovum sp. 17-42-90]OZA59505.1 MAG: 2-oxoglutarate synthase [Sulfurovum sp. 39-42-12]HQR73953.1 2-oxoacid:ferredoxin oxidoreductase subunit beta [Sulfurovum sp.]